MVARIVSRQVSLFLIRLSLFLMRLSLETRQIPLKSRKLSLEMMVPRIKKGQCWHFWKYFSGFTNWCNRYQIKNPEFLPGFLLPILLSSWFFRGNGNLNRRKWFWLPERSFSKRLSGSCKRPERPHMPRCRTVAWCRRAFRG
jgi:hypothetical protein